MCNDRGRGGKYKSEMRTGAIKSKRGGLREGGKYGLIQSSSRRARVKNRANQGSEAGLAGDWSFVVESPRQAAVAFWRRARAERLKSSAGAAFRIYHERENVSFPRRAWAKITFLPLSQTWTQDYGFQMEPSWNSTLGTATKIPPSKTGQPGLALGAPPPPSFLRSDPWLLPQSPFCDYPTA